ncbi:hypothetical protein L6164_016936 [Bauhinia variegata]|uniref:Uncharacterized protein n=1 Tax=Bauhinia variegata TaxID=167791 RepID=A0ACB9N628_BAUVA|nr:hypothetical protein L6164_016936 [Bauhinia variegata]
MESGVEMEIVIIGGGICGLATALALHRKGIRSLVLEKSETLRPTGAALIVLTNGWCALDQLGVGTTLRRTAIQIERGKLVLLSENDEPKEIPFGVCEEFRCVRRRDLLEAMADCLPVGTIRFGCQVVSVEIDSKTLNPLLQLSDGSTLHAKVVIGCDGVNSIVANMVGLKSTKRFSTCATRGLTNYPNGHEFGRDFVMISKDKVQVGIIAVNDQLVYWFITRLWTSRDSKVSRDSTLIRQSAMESMKGFPIDAIEMISKCELNSLHLADLRYRPLWDLVLSNFRKGTMTVAGDAMHATGPFLAQGGSASIEDAVVLGRCLAQKIMKIDKNVVRVETLVKEAFDNYVKERKMRILWLSLHTYLIGKKLDTKSFIVNSIIISIMAILFKDPDVHCRYDCGEL